jgi:hypothetical protein
LAPILNFKFKKKSKHNARKINLADIKQTSATKWLIKQYFFYLAPILNFKLKKKNQNIMLGKLIWQICIKGW